jgi:hypothetical protein
MKKHIEIITITTNNIAVTVKIDYDEMKMSLVEKKGCKYETKTWMFAGRSIGYKKSWNEILEAMGKAIEFGMGKLKKEDDSMMSNNIDKIDKFLDK